mmetsp:Transcript_17752/g.35721  ORF Transcript_17752/g.35721 Transcript_17752/m.35721 type:complete len:102 (-) Transcript_17752:50-355(-)
MNILSNHKVELQQLKSESANEIDSLKKRLEMECKFRFCRYRHEQVVSHFDPSYCFDYHPNCPAMKRSDAEKRAAALETLQNEQKSKMQNAIEGLAKQFTGS